MRARPRSRLESCSVRAHRSEGAHWEKHTPIGREKRDLNHSQDRCCAGARFTLHFVNCIITLIGTLPPHPCKEIWRSQQVHGWASPQIRHSVVVVCKYAQCKELEAGRGNWRRGGAKLEAGAHFPAEFQFSDFAEITCKLRREIESLE